MSEPIYDALRRSLGEPARAGSGPAVDAGTTGADSNEALLDAAEAWLAQDPDEETRAELSALIAAARDADDDALAELHSRFDERLAFGTAGLRGEIAAGPARMNRVLVSQAAAGLAAFLLQRSAAPSIVIGYDGRRNSRVFATDTAEIMAGAGIRTTILPRLLPTPVLAFAVRHLDTSAGVMVTASHNPPNDNGYKVYLGDDDQGSQIVSPDDVAIAAQIDRVAAEENVLELPRSGDYEIAEEAVIDEYIARTAALATDDPQSIRFVYTAMHGVGLETASRVFAAAGFSEEILVDEQAQPDPSFPTVAFPNPEEPGALDLALARAEAADAELIIANDPDADRLAVAIPDADSATGWRALSGNEVGYLLGWRAAERLHAAGEHGALAASIVSSPALQRVAEHYGLDAAETLTGFKWVSRVDNIAYGYEEALGYLVDPDKVRDKDGISAAVDFLSLVSELKASGTSLREHISSFDATFGAHVSSQISIRVTDLGDITRVMASLRENPPSEIGSAAVTSIDDFQLGVGDFPTSDILRITLEGDRRVIVRPSGTEPKLKIYIDASCVQEDTAARRPCASEKVAELEAAMRVLIS